MSADFAERLREMIGVAGEPYVAHDRVNEAMIRHWCEALGDDNPRYQGPGTVAPPAMLGAWTMRGQQPQPAGEAPRTKVMRLLDEAGYTSVVATNSEQEYVRYLKPGDLVVTTSSVESVSKLKQTALGEGYFVTTLHEFRDEAGELVGTQRQRLLKFKPKPSVGKRPKPAINADSQYFWEGCARGELLIQRCISCGALRHPPRPSCGECRSLEWDTVASSGAGELYSFAVHHHPPVPGFEPPFVVALVALDVGVRIVSNLIGVDPADVKIGTRVRVRFVKVDDALTLPLFEPEDV